jgi:hypothetical protein
MANPTSTFDTVAPASHARVNPRFVALGFIIVFVAAAWFGFRPERIVTDWAGWREADTQAIARHLSEPGSRGLFYPQIDWGGAGPGYVETEMQLYAALIAPFLRVFGNVEWPGQMISLAAIVIAAWTLFCTYARAYGERAGLVGLAAFLVAPVVTYIDTSVQPEALCLALFALAWQALLRYEAEGSKKQLAIFAACGGLAMLVKPTAAQLGIASFVVLALSGRPRLRAVFPWLAWTFMVGALGLFMWHAHRLYVEYGNTFGVLSGGDSKVPDVEHLLNLGTYRAALGTVVVWGFGYFGAVAFVVAVLRRRADAPMWGLFAANVVWTLISLRYVSHISWGGLHYSMISAVLAGHAAAALVPREGRPRSWEQLVALGLAGATSLFTLHARMGNLAAKEFAMQLIAAGEKLAVLSRPEDLVAVRSPTFAYDMSWHTPNNFEDPRVFYVANRRGWAIGSDQTAPADLEKLARLGARYYVEPARGMTRESIDGWLSEHAQLVATTDVGGRIYALSR